VSLKIAIIGGTDVEKLAEVLRVRLVEVETPFGNVPAFLGEGELANLAFISRHGSRRDLPPHRINHRANLKALQQLGVDRVVAMFSVGSLNEEIPPGALVVLDQFIDLTGRVETFHDGDGGALVHADLTEPFCGPLRGCLAERARAAGLEVREGGTYACTNGPRLETAAEIRMLRLLGADVVGMTAGPETILARELHLHYAGIAVAIKWAAGVDGPRDGADKAAMTGVRSRLLPAILEALRSPDAPGCACKAPPASFLSIRR
jgi:5'-methylthioadenosine phosphorylase